MIRQKAKVKRQKVKLEGRYGGRLEDDRESLARSGPDTASGEPDIARVRLESSRKSIVRTVAFCLFTLAFCLLSSCRPSATMPVKADATYGVCPVCLMKVEAGDPWASEVYYSDGMKLMFESPGDMMTFYSAPEKYKVPDAQKDRAKVVKIVVKDYQTKEDIDARKANLVYKSKVEGPMGPDFLPFSKREDADSFVAANGGKVIALNEVTPEMIQNLRKK